MCRLEVNVQYWFHFRDLMRSAHISQTCVEKEAERQEEEECIDLARVGARRTKDEF